VSLSSTVDDIQIIRRRIVSEGVCVDGHLDFGDWLVSVAVVDFDGRSIAFHYKEFL
jgi:hypothetical protein